MENHQGSLERLAKEMNRRIVIVAALISVFCLTVSVKAFAEGTGLPAGKASGYVSIDNPLSLNYVYAVVQPNMLDKEKTDIAVLLTEKPLADGALKDVDDLWAFAAHCGIYYAMKDVSLGRTRPCAV
jgi:hypothetical protein